MDKPFNATFFATAAVIIPVLFFAVALQTDYVTRALILYARIAADAEAGDKRRTENHRFVIIGSLLTTVPQAWFAGIFGIPAVLVLFFGVLGEILSLLALEQRQALASSASLVMFSVVLLVVAGGLAASWRTAETFYKASLAEERSKAIAADRAADDI